MEVTDFTANRGLETTDTWLNSIERLPAHQRAAGNNSTGDWASQNTRKIKFPLTYWFHCLLGSEINDRRLNAFRHYSHTPKSVGKWSDSSLSFTKNPTMIKSLEGIFRRAKEQRRQLHIYIVTTHLPSPFGPWEGCFEETLRETFRGPFSFARRRGD